MLIILFYAASASAGSVVVFDRVTVEKKPVFLKALTKGILFPEGGKLVSFYLAEKLIGRNLSGGDGYAYLKYHPDQAGYIKISAQVNEDAGTGLLLVMNQNEKAIIIEIDSVLSKNPMVNEVVADSVQAVETLSNDYKIIYISGLLGSPYSKKWLAQKKFPESIVIIWKGTESLEMLKEKGVDVFAVIASAAIVSDAAEYIEKRYTFEATEEATMVEDWPEILKLIKE